ncbi:hypothetical protein COO60DRAFT_265686 [Scenedesmus sp. NREL 46B-D3]|nr:hypothetical protein COO60DRAFT_265686 [Scenedesmus sp. NREL 46B-D3]
MRISKLSRGVSTLLLPELRVFQAPHLSVTFPPGAFSRLEHLCLNYRLANLCRALAAAAGPSLQTVSIVPGKRKGSHWQVKLCRLLQLQPLSACVHLTELVLSELVMGYSGEGHDDQSGSGLTPEEAAAVAAGVAAAAAGAEQTRRLQEQQGHVLSSSCRSSSCRMMTSYGRCCPSCWSGAVTQQARQQLQLWGRRPAAQQQRRRRRRRRAGRGACDDAGCRKQRAGAAAAAAAGAALHNVVVAAAAGCVGALLG